MLQRALGSKNNQAVMKINIMNTFVRTIQVPSIPHIEVAAVTKIPKKLGKLPEH
jgi:hypothetical protein